MRFQFSIFLCLLCALLIVNIGIVSSEESVSTSNSSSDNPADSPSVPDEPSVPDFFAIEGFSVGQIIRWAGINSVRNCQQFASEKSLNERKNKWKQALQGLDHAHREELLGWLVGSKSPHSLVLREAEFQKNCMLTEMVNQAARKPSALRLILNFEEAFEGEFKDMEELTTAFQKDHQNRRRILRYLTRSGYRNAASQAGIWHRKMVFQGRSFNIISEHSAKRCELISGHTWKPHLQTHRSCWNDVLSAHEREREILSASAAPGLSRHHWGTDFDILSLNPHHFSNRGILANAYVWLQANTLKHGFVQPYQATPPTQEIGYMEERWHWSYYPIAQAFVEYIRENEALFEAALHAQWNAFEAQWNRRRADDESLEFFGFIRRHWRAYVFPERPAAE